MRTHSACPWRIDQNDVPWQSLPDNNAQLHALPADIGKCQSKLIELDTGLNKIETVYHPNRDLAVLSRFAPQEPRLVLTLGLTGQSCFRGSRGDEICFKAGFSTVTTFNASNGSRQYRGQDIVAQMRFTMTRSWLERYFGEGAFASYLQENSLQLVSHHTSKAGTLIGAQSMLQNRLQGQAQKVFRQGQSIAIIANELSHLLRPEHRDFVRLSKQEKRLVETAQDILHAEFKEPPSIESLSKRVGTNPFKLKQLFHHHFNTTPYGMLLDIRMQQAQGLLLSGQLPINQIAETLGYRHASNFSAAFCKYFGYPPKHLKGKNGR